MSSTVLEAGKSTVKVQQAPFTVRALLLLCSQLAFLLYPHMAKRKRALMSSSYYKDTNLITRAHPHDLILT